MPPLCKGLRYALCALPATHATTLGSLLFGDGSTPPTISSTAQSDKRTLFAEEDLAEIAASCPGLAPVVLRLMPAAARAGLLTRCPFELPNPPSESLSPMS